MGNKRNKRSRQRQEPSLEKEMRSSEAETSHGNETMIETLSIFEKVSSTRKREDFDTTQNENEMQVWAH